MKRFLLWSLLASQALANPLVIHVGTNGNDHWSGAQPQRIGNDGPMATLSAALAKARAERSGEVVSILVHGGVYQVAEPIVFTPADSGSAGKPFTIGAFENEKPTLSGGQRITGWTQVPEQKDLWQTEVRPQLGTNWYFRSLFIDGQRATRARTPNEGELWRMDGARFNDQPFQFKFQAGQLNPKWVAAGDAEVVAFEKWTDIRQFIRAIDTVSNVVTLSGSSTPYTREAGARYFVENTRDSLDQPGEWFLDRQTGLLTCMFQPGVNPNRAEVVAPRLQELVRFAGDLTGRKAVHHIALRGLTFADTDWTMPADGYRDTQAAVAIRGEVFGDGMTDCVIEDCTFTRLAGYGVDLGRGCQRNRISGNEMFDLGAGGVRVGETAVRKDAFDATRDNRITDNHLHHLGRIYPPAVGVFVIQSAGNRVAHNHIHDLYYTAVSVGWTWGYRDSPCHDNVIEFNHLHDIGQGLLSDMGAVYTLGPQPGTVVRNNLIHDVSSFTYGGWGLYTDEGSTGIVLENNVVYRCKSSGFHQHYGKENVIRNNVFAFNKDSQFMRTRDEAHLSFYFTNNLVLLDSGQVTGGSWKNDQFVSDGNLYWDTRGTNQPLRFGGGPLPRWQARGHDTNSIVADPQFVNAAKENFQLQPGSPAFKLGFDPIDLSEVGVRPKARRL